MEAGFDELPDAIKQEDLKHREAWRMAETFLAAPFPRFTDWLTHHKIAEVPPRTVKRNTIYRRLLKKGLWSSWQSTKARVRDEWWGWPENGTEVGEKIFFSKRLKEEILWRLCETLMVDIGQDVIEARRDAEPIAGANQDEGMEFLPPWMRWVANHPFLTVSEETVQKDEKLKADAEAYLSKCPNQAAKNWYVTIRGDSKMLGEFWKQVGAKYSEEVKRTDKKPDAEEDEESQANLDHVMNLEEMLGVK